ncbi:MAG: anti-sigma factor [Bacteroidota bacterium]
MNIKEYISSGILESYALGELTEAERLEVERNLAQYPELRKELALVEETMEAFLMKAAVTPPAGVKEKIFESIGEAKIIPLNTWRYATAASIVFALTASYFALTFYHNWKQSETQLIALQTQNEQFAQDYNKVNQRLGDIETQMQVINNPAFQRVVMTGTPKAPEALASVYWNQTSQEVYLSVQNLKALAQDQQYQLWAIVDGKPVDIGVFDTSTALLKMKSTGKAAAFAVTIEPRGGKSTPSDTMQVVGKS